MKKEIRKINEEVVIKLAKKDYDKLAKNEKSYELFSWLRDELIISETEKENVLLFTPKAFARIVNILARLRERNLDKCDVQILDRENIKLTFAFDLTTLTLYETRRVNQEYGLTIPEPKQEEDEDDEIFAHR